MITANVHDAKTNLSKLLAKVAEGERVVITNRGNPVAELSKPKDDVRPLKALFGSMKGEIEVPDNFEWTDAEIEELFYGPIEPKA